ncbi:MAG: hypothetical protein II097_04905 [Bacteroidales bacterium]|jgi:hypothetical protein|nr:hypothetical protein [Bacteroidales bacterium]
MKKFFALTLCLFASVLLFAQPQGKPNEEQRKKDWERLQAEKIAFITQELDLTPEEAQVFWPVYNQCWKEVLASHKATREAFAGIRGKQAEGLTDKEMEKKLDAYIQASTRSNQVLADWYPKFKQVLPIRKVAKLYQAEEAFQQRMINNLRKHPQHPSK